MKAILHTLSTIFIGCNIVASAITPRTTDISYTDRFSAEPKDGTVIEYSFLKKDHTNLTNTYGKNSIRRINNFNCYNLRAANCVKKLHI